MLWQLAAQPTSEPYYAWTPVHRMGQQRMAVKEVITVADRRGVLRILGLLLDQQFQVAQVYKTKQCRHTLIDLKSRICKYMQSLFLLRQISLQSYCAEGTSECCT